MRRLNSLGRVAAIGVGLVLAYVLARRYIDLQIIGDWMGGNGP
jgi:hypothetical protein